MAHPGPAEASVELVVGYDRLRRRYRSQRVVVVGWQRVVIGWRGLVDPMHVVTVGRDILGADILSADIFSADILGASTVVVVVAFAWWSWPVEG